MKITNTQMDGKSVVKIEGDLRIGSVADAKAELVAILAANNDIQLDLSDIGQCDTAGIQLLLMTRASAGAAGNALITIGDTPAFRAALARLGIAAECFEAQTSALDANSSVGTAIVTG